MNPQFLHFNRGRISPLALARIDFDRLAMSAEVQTNWMPRTLGPMSLRAGMGYTGGTQADRLSVTIPFIYSRTDTARIELTDGAMRVWVNDQLITRPAVTTAITNGSFTTDLSGWTDLDSGSAVSNWVTGGFMLLSGTGTSAARRRQQVTVTSVGIQHALDIVVDRGPILIRVGSTAGGDEYIAETSLATGIHSLTLTPTGDFYIDLLNYEERSSLVGSIEIAAAGVMVIGAPWQEADLYGLRWDQSGDVVFVASANHRQRRIERRDNGSWSVVIYQSNNGPFRIQNLTPLTLAPSAATGNITLTASQPLFTPEHVGTLYKLTQTGQSAEVELTGDNQFSAPIRVAGNGNSRLFAVVITGTFTATVTLQYSVGDPGDWVDAASGVYFTPTSVSYNDTLDGQIIYYRIGIKSGNYTSGTANALLSYSSGSQTGIARMTGYVSSTSVTADTLQPFGNVSATSEWSESYWSEYRGYPSSVALYEGRLWWAGKDRVWGSVSDSFANFDDEVEGDSAPISRSIGSGPVDVVHWLMPLQRLVLGCEGEIRSARSSSFDEPLTPTNFNLKGISTDGALDVNSVKIGTSGIYASGNRIYESGYDAGTYDYASAEISQLVPEIGDPGIVRLAAQQKPEKRVHVVRTDGTVGLMVYDKQEQVTCWVDIETDGVVEDVVVLPGMQEDYVYYTVKRVINGNTKRYHEKFAFEEECRGYPDAKLADSFIEYSGASTATITGLGHLEGESVVAWGWDDDDTAGRDLGTYTVASGSITLSVAVENAIVGLPYTATYKSTKLSYALKDGTMLCMKKKVTRIGVIARWIHRDGLEYGPSFDLMDSLPLIEGYTEVVDEMRLEYDEAMFTFAGDWDTDSRICLQAAAPRPVTLLAVVADMEVQAK